MTKKKGRAEQHERDAGEDPGESRALAKATFRSGHQVEVLREGTDESLVIRAESGECVLQIAMTAAGPVLKLSGVALEISADASLALRAGHLDVRAGSASIEIAGDLTEHVGGNAERRSDGATRTAAREVAVVAHPGGVQVRANDDIDLNGERVRLNSDDQPMALSWEEFERRRRELGS